MRRIVSWLCVWGLAACTGAVTDPHAEDRDSSFGNLAPDGGTDGGLDASVYSRDATVVATDGGRRTPPVDAGTRVPTTDARAAAVDAGATRVDARAATVDAGTTTPDPDAGSGISLGPPAVRLVGRMDSSDAAGPKFAWSGSGVIARFMGTSVAVTLAGGQEYAVLIDGMSQPKLVPGSGTTPIVSGLADGVHLVELYRRTEASQGESQFQGFTFAGGGMLLPPPLAPARRLEIIGDSITCGFGDEGADETCGFTPQTENHYLTYGAIAARAVGADLNTIAWSGIGMVCNYGDAADSCTNPMPTYYDRTLPGRTDSQWDFSTYQPQAVIINLGTNDFSTDSDPSEAEFTSAYRNFLLHLRSKYPNALILCTCGPLLWGADLDMVRGYIASAVAATGDGNIKTFNIDAQNSADGLGCSYHPSLKTHQKMADVVVTELASELGW